MKVLASDSNLRMEHLKLFVPLTTRRLLPSWIMFGEDTRQGWKIVKVFLMKKLQWTLTFLSTTKILTWLSKLKMKFQVSIQLTLKQTWVIGECVTMSVAEENQLNTKMDVHLL